MNNESTTTGVRDSFIRKATKVIRNLGIVVNENDDTYVSLTIADRYSGGIVITPITFGVSEDDLINLANRVNSLGWCGRRVIKAMVDAVNELDDVDRNSLRTRCFIRQYDSIGILKYLSASIFNMIEAQGVKITKNHLTIKSARNLWLSFGGYRGLKEMFTECICETIDEIRRIQRLEKKLNSDNIIDVDNPTSIDYIGGFRRLSFRPMCYEKFKCLTCCHCKVDKFGARICKRGYVEVPERLTVEEVNKVYPSVVMLESGELCSRYIMYPVGECDMYKSRIGYGVKDQQETDITISETLTC